MKMNQKTYSAKMMCEGAEDEDNGAFKAVFSTFDVIDHHGDVTLPGAFTDGQQVIIEGWNHNYTMPAGVGAIYSDESKAWVEGRFFLDTAVGLENYRTVKALGNSEWSYTFDILAAEPGTKDGRPVQLLKALDVVGVAPVTRGAGIGTHTIMVKSQQAQNEGEAGDGKPSGVAPAVLLAKIKLMEMEQ
jgi:hypothetical protein